LEISSGKEARKKRARKEGKGKQERSGKPEDRRYQKDGAPRAKGRRLLRRRMKIIPSSDKIDKITL